MDLRINSFRTGSLTFNAEGLETKGLYFSRAMHWPGGKSGVTIGRGYDLGVEGRTKAQVIKDLTAAGVPSFDASRFAQAVGLKGEKAKNFVNLNRAYFPEISVEAQDKLFFDILLPRYTSEVKRISEKPDVVAKYGATDWDNLDPRIKDVAVDLIYRGDYTGHTREKVQPFIVKNDVDGLKTLMNDSQYWKGLGVPDDRFQRRAEFLD